MAGSQGRTGVYLEVGQKRTFAGALEWPGWCRSGRDEASALAALLEYGPRYAKVVARSGLGFASPGATTDFEVVERLTGNSTTDFGAANVAPARDAEPFDDAASERSEAILQAIWQVFDQAAQSAEGKELRKGPRGGGRERDPIVQHVLGANAAYLRKVAQPFRQDASAAPADELRRTRAAMRAALAAGVRGDIPERGPRGGVYWTPRYYVRRVAWHTLDHAWELEDRIL